MKIDEILLISCWEIFIPIEYMVLNKAKINIIIIVDTLILFIILLCLDINTDY